MERKKSGKQIGSIIKKAREEQGMGLRGLASKVGVTAGYLSQVERGEGSLPTEKTVTAIADALGQNSDELLALTDHLAADLIAIMRKDPRKMATFLRVASKLPSGEIERLTQHWERRSGPSRLPSGKPDRRKSPEDKIGLIIKKMRLEKGVVLLGLADQIGVTAGYLSKIERGEGSRPTEKMVTTIAKALGQHPDDLLALAGHLAPDLTVIMQKDPKKMAAFLRAAGRLPLGEIETFTHKWERRSKPRV